MMGRTRITITMLWQIALGINYSYGVINIGLPFFNVAINLHKSKMDFFLFNNLIWEVKRNWLNPKKK